MCLRVGLGGVFCCLRRGGVGWGEEGTENVKDLNPKGEIAKMRIQCDSCESKFASVMCCADEAALCSDCDARIHAANKLASKHQRVPFLAVSEPSHCDICQVCYVYV